MKVLIAALAFMGLQQVTQAASHTDLKDGDLSYSLASAKIVSVKNVCGSPVPNCDAYGSKVEVEVKLNGCVDRLGGTTHSFRVVDGKGYLSFAALNINNEASTRTFCVKAPTKLVTVLVPYEGVIELDSLQFSEEKVLLEKGDLTLSQADATIVSTRPLCPSNGNQPTCAGYGSFVKVKVGLNGCADKLGGYIHQLDRVDGKGVLKLAVLNIGTESSTRIRCVAQPEEVIEFFIPNMGPLELQKLQFNGTATPTLL